MSNGPDRSRGRYRQENSGPYSRDSRGRGPSKSQEVTDLQAAEEFIKVGGQSNVKAVAGKIAHSSRAGDPPAMLATGGPAVNQAIKALSIAREYLRDEGLDVAFQPAFLNPDRSKPALALYLAKHPPRANGLEAEMDFSVSSGSNPQNVAGALSARIRDGKSVSLTAIGIDAVANAVLAVGNARVYLEEDRMDVRVFPEFVKVSKGDMDLSALRFMIVAEEI